jgi:hypothetical protein
MKVHGEPERRCIVTRQSQPKAGLVRFVVGPDDEVVPDIAGRLPGRGIWVGAEASTLRRAVERGHFARGARRAVRVAPDLPERVEALLARHLVELIALARKAGQAIAGREKTLAALREGHAALLIQASDGSEREKAALRPPEGQDTHVCCLRSDELGMAFGRDRVIHAAVLADGLADRIRIESLRLAGIRDGGDRRLIEDEAGAGVAGEGPRGKAKT